MNNFSYSNQPPLHAGGYHHSNEYTYDYTAVGHKYADRSAGGQGVGKSEPSLNSNWVQNRGNGQSYCQSSTYYPQQIHQLQLPMGIQTERPRPSHAHNYAETNSWTTPIVAGDLPVKRYEPYDASRQKQNWNWNQNRKEEQGYRPSYPQQQTQANKLHRPLKEMYKSTSYASPRANWTASNNANSGSRYPSQQSGFRSKFVSHGQRYNEGKFKKAKVASPFGIQKCDVCLVDLNSSLQAKMHYVGKKHEKKFKLNALLQGKKTGDSSVENEEGAASSEKKPSTGGENLTESNKLKTYGQPEEKNNSSSVGIKKLEASSEPSGQFTCKLCNVITTSADQLDAHYNGAKHKKASKLAGDNSFEEKDKIPVAASAGSLLLLPLQISNASSDGDKSNGRTPAGTFFCKSCNIMLNSETQFTAHCESKKHKKK